MPLGMFYVAGNAPIAWAMVPIALGQGPGSGARASMAKVIIGGQMLSLLLALLVTPVFYSLLDSMSSWFRRRLKSPPKPTSNAPHEPPAPRDVRQPAETVA